MAIPIGTLAERLDGELRGDGRLEIDGVAALEKAGPTDISFIADEAHLRRLSACSAGAVLVSRALAGSLPDSSSGPLVLLVDDAQAGFIEALTSLRPPRPRPTIGISPDAFVHPTARIGADTNVHPGAFIGEDAVIGENCEVHSGVRIGAGCRVGDGVILYPNAVLYDGMELGNRVIIHAGAVIGADGFGYRVVEGRRMKIPHFGTVRIEDDVEIGACTTVDRAMIGATVVGEGTKLDNLVMIGHNCELGRHNVMVSQVGLAGSVTTGDHVVCAGHVGIADHVHLGARCIIGSKAGVHKDVPEGQTYVGTPAQPAAEAVKAVMALRKLPELRRQVHRLETTVAELTARLEALAPPEDDSPSNAAA